MPIYECSCRGCGIDFEVLASVNEARRAKPCPSCGRPAPRVPSTFAIRGPVRAAAAPAAEAPRTGKPTVPGLARLCWMDDPSAERFSAYRAGRGAEYDDKQAAREETRRRRGEPPPPVTGQHSHVQEALARKKKKRAGNASTTR